MINIAKKKLPVAAILVIVYLSFCASNWFMMRGNLAYYANIGMPSWIANDIMAFFFGGLLPIVIYALLSNLIMRNLMLRVGGDVQSLRYGFHYAITAANIVLALVKLVYLAAPLYAELIDIIINPVITVGFAALYLLYAFKMNYVDKTRYGIVVMQVMGLTIMLYGILALVNLIISVA